MAIEPEYTINTIDNTATLNIFVDAVFITQYTFQNSLVTLGERISPVAVSLQELSRNLQIINVWIGLINKYLKVVPQSNSFFEEEIDKTAVEVFGKYVQEVLISNATFNPVTKIFLFQPRVEINFLYIDFKYWYDFLRTLNVTARDY